MVESVRKIKVIFPKKENQLLSLKVDFGAPVLDLIESLEKDLSVPDDSIVVLYQDEKSEAAINVSRTLEEQGIEPGCTLFAYLKERGMHIQFKTLVDCRTLSIHDRMVKLKDMKLQVFSALNLPLSRPYDFIRIDNGTIIPETQNFLNFASYEAILVKEIPIAGGCYVIDNFHSEKIQDRLEIYFPLANKLVRLTIQHDQVRDLQKEISEHMFPDWMGSVIFYLFGAKMSLSAALSVWASKAGRTPPLVCLGPNKIEDHYKNHLTEVSPVWDEPFSSKPIPIMIDAQIKYQQTYARLLKNIREATARFKAQTVVNFIEIDETETQFHFAWIHISLSDTGEISSSVGRSAGYNPILLTPYAPPYAIMHELMHAIGFVHEHQRHDRDRFVEVNNKYRSDPDYMTVDSYFPIGTYDPRSIMHYHFIEKEIKPKSDGLLTTQEKKILSKADPPTEFSGGDIDAIDFIYGSKRKCTFEKTAKDYTSQPYYECLTCWGTNSRLGCCASCRRFCHNGHDVIYHPPGDELFFCDCGVNKHELGCTKASTGDTRHLQPMFTSLDCPTASPLCFPCAKKLNCLSGEVKEALVKGVCACKNKSCNI